MVCERGDVLALACAVSKAFPMYSRKTSGSAVKTEKQTVSVGFITVGTGGAPLSDEEVQCLNDACEGVMRNDVVLLGDDVMMK